MQLTETTQRSALCSENDFWIGALRQVQWPCLEKLRPETEHSLFYAFDVFVLQGFHLKCVFPLKLKVAVTQCVTSQPAWLKGFGVFHYSVAHCFALRLTWGAQLLSSSPISSCSVSTSTGGWGSQRRHKAKYSIFPLAHPWNVARCRMRLKPQAKMEMWKYLILNNLSSCPLLTLVSNHGR